MSEIEISSLARRDIHSALGKVTRKKRTWHFVRRVGLGLQMEIENGQGGGSGEGVENK